MSEKGPAPDIKPRRVKVAEVPKTDLIGLSPKERAPAPTRTVVPQNPHVTVGALWRASLWGLWTSNRVEFKPNVIIE
jgi:hypothetical protein